MSIDVIIPVIIISLLILVVRRLTQTDKRSYEKIKKPLKSSDYVSSQKVKNVIDSAIAQNNQSPPVNDHIFKALQRPLPDSFLAFNLFSSKQMDEERQQTVAAISQSFRRPHPLLLPLTQSTFEPNELFELIKTDAEMTAKILKVVNSPLFALSQPITNINHAIIFLGVAQVKNIAMQFAVLNDVKFKDKAQNEAYQKIWQASYTASAFCLLLAKELAQENAAELATQCLLSYLGDLALLSFKPDTAVYYLDSFSLFERTQIAQGALNTNTAEVGTFIAKQWQLPSSIKTSIGDSLLMLTNDPRASSFTQAQLQQNIICYLACRIGDLVAYHDVKDITNLPQVSFDTLGQVDVYYLQENIKKSGLEKINTVLADVSFKNKVNKLIAQLHSGS